jgi:methionine-rich copper-binding protein CopC/putative copper export protein
VNLRRIALGTAVALGALMGIGPAAVWAHPLLISATPQPGVVAHASPADISLAFTEKAVPRGSRIRLFAPDGRRLPVSPIAASVGGRTLSVAPRGKLESAVYRVLWSALGEDGHLVSGAFEFGVAGAKGQAPPGVEKLSPAGGGRGAESAAGDGFETVIGRWLGILAASLLLSAAVLRRRLRRHGADDEDTAILPQLAPVIWVLLAMAALEGVLSAASQGTGGKLDAQLLTASVTGVSELVRFGLVLVLSLLLALTTQRRRGRDLLYGAGGFAVLLTYGLSGHVLSFPSVGSLIVQAAHVVAAGLWLGGVIVLALLAARGRVRLLDGARAFAPVAGTALLVAGVTGVLAAVREVHRWYFLRWSGYGHVVIIKTAVVAVVSVAGLIAWWRSRGEHAPGPPRRLLRAEALGVVAVLALATTLSGLAQGRGQPLPAQKGTLFPGPALVTALFSKANAHVAVAPARPGANVVAVSIAPGQPQPRAVSVRLSCGCTAARVRATLQAHGDPTWSAPVTLPKDGTWYAYVTVDGRTAPPEQISVGIPDAPGAPAAQVLAVADLTGPGAERCRANIIGLELALARLNANGGVDGGHKVAPLVLDSGGTAAGAAAAARRGLRSHPIALAGACGTGGAAAVAAAARTGAPSIVSDPSVDPTPAPNAFRLAADPYAQGVAFGQLVRNRILAASVPGVRTVRLDAGDDAQGRRLEAGVRAGLRPASAVKGMPVTPGPAPKLVVVEPGSLARLSEDALARVLDRRQTAALVLDGPSAGGPDAGAVARLGAARGTTLTPPPILTSERVLSETYVERAGALGRIGAIQGVTEVSTSTPDAELYQAAVPALFRGDFGSLDGLRGYAGGLALIDALRAGTKAREMISSLEHPQVFTDALLSPWAARRPGYGEPFVLPLQPQFLSANLLPTQAGGEQGDSEYFQSGSWTITAQVPLGITGGIAWPRLQALRG